MRAFADIFTRNDHVCALIPALAKRHRLVLASNTCDAHYLRYSEDYADVLAHISALCTSHEAKARKSPAAEAETAGLAGLIAAAGFNAAKGLNAAAGRAAYPLGKANAPGGIGEKGWQGLWPAAANAKYVTDPTAEGDGAVRLTAGNFARTWSKPQAGVFRVELMARVPAGGGVMGYVWGEREPTTGPVWRITAGKFQALDGSGFGSGNWTAVADCPADTWHKVTLGIDVAKQQWTLAAGDAAPSKAFGFRYKAPALQTLNFLVEGKEEAYLDAVRVLAGDGKE